MKKKYCSNCGGRLHTAVDYKNLPKDFKDLNKSLHHGSFDFEDPSDVYYLYMLLFEVDNKEAERLEYIYCPKDYNFYTTRQGFKKLKETHPKELKELGEAILHFLTTHRWDIDFDKYYSDFYYFKQKEGAYGFWLDIDNRIKSYSSHVHNILYHLSYMDRSGWSIINNLHKEMDTFYWENNDRMNNKQKKDLSELIEKMTEDYILEKLREDEEED